MKRSPKELTLSDGCEGIKELTKGSSTTEDQKEVQAAMAARDVAKAVSHKRGIAQAAIEGPAASYLADAVELEPPSCDRDRDRGDRDRN